MLGRRISKWLVTMLCATTLLGCAATPVAVQCPSLPPVPKHLLEPAKNKWLLAPPTSNSSETQPKTRPE